MAVRERRLLCYPWARTHWFPWPPAIANFRSVELDWIKIGGILMSAFSTASYQMSYRKGKLWHSPSSTCLTNKFLIYNLLSEKKDNKNVSTESTGGHCFPWFPWFPWFPTFIPGPCVVLQCHEEELQMIKDMNCWRAKCMSPDRVNFSK